MQYFYIEMAKDLEKKKWHTSLPVYKLYEWGEGGGGVGSEPGIYIIKTMHSYTLPM